MNTFVFVLLCAQACLIQNAFGQCLGGIGPGYAGPSFAAPAGPYGWGAGPSGPYGWGAGLAGPGCGAAYGGAGAGNVAVAGELPVGGATAVAGQVPIIGGVEFSGVVPAAGTVTISGSCACGCGPYGY